MPTSPDDVIPSGAPQSLAPKEVTKASTAVQPDDDLKRTADGLRAPEVVLPATAHSEFSYRLAWQPPAGSYGAVLPPITRLSAVDNTDDQKAPKSEQNM